MSRYRKPSKRPAAGKTLLCLSALVLAAAIGGVHAAAAETEPTEGREQIIHKEVSYAAECIVEEAEKITGVIAEAAADPYRDRPDIDPDDWMYILANPWNEIGDYTPELASLEGQQFDERIVDDMEAFAEAARAEGLSVFLSSGYRSYDTQMYLFRRKAAEYGEEVAQTIVARPGTSEHQTGLCCGYGALSVDERPLPGIRLHRPISQGKRGCDRNNL